MGRRSVLILALALAVLGVAFLVNWTASSAAPGLAPSYFPTPEPKPTSPSPDPQPTGSSRGGGGGGGSRFMHCNSTISGRVTDFGSMIPGSNVLVEVGASGWKSQQPADTNGHFAFQGLCEGTAYVKAVVPPGSLLTNPNAEVELDGRNRVDVDLGFFLPLPQAVSSGGAEATPIPLVTSPSVPQVVVVPAPVNPPVQPPQLVSLPRGVTVDLSAPRKVRVGMDADVSISVQNGGPGAAVDTVVRLSLASGILLKEADTSRGSLKIQVVPQAVGKVGGVAAPLAAPPSELVIDVGTLNPGEIVLIATKLVFKDTKLSGSQTQIQARAVSGNDSFWSSSAVITVEAAGGAFLVTLPTTGEGSYDRYFREFLW